MSDESCGTLSCPPGQLWGAGCLKDTSSTEGATTLARLYFLEDNGQLQTDTANGIIASIVSYGYVYASVQCQQAFVDEQVQRISCDDTPGGPGELVPQNPNCVKCKSKIAEIVASRQALEELAHQKNPQYKIQVVDPKIKDAFIGVASDPYAAGVCKYVCEQCVAENVSQNIQMRVVEDCSSRINTDAFATAFTSGMSLQAESSLTKHQNALKTTGLAIQKSEDVKNLSIQIADTIRQMTCVRQLNNLNQQALNIQETAINAGSTSVVIENASQAISVSMFASLASQTYNNDSVSASINLKEQRQLVQVETSFADLLNKLATTVRTMDQLLLSTVGKIMVTVVALILMILVIVASLFFFKPDLLFGAVTDVMDKL